jgi:SAM-dependent methyltransferase
MTNKNYKSLFEGRFTKTNKNLKLGLLKKIYYYLSPSTYTERVLYQYIDSIFKLHDYQPLKILDVGCGGGNDRLNAYGNVIGVDVSEKSVINAKKIYRDAYVIDVSKGLPFSENSFDMIYCSEVVGHIYQTDKDLVFAEMKRVLKQGGFIAMSIETEGVNWLTSALKRRGLYNELWIDSWGHIGLETPHETLARIARHFSISNHRPTSTYIFQADILAGMDKLAACLGLLRKQNWIRVINILLALPFLLSIFIYKNGQINNIVLTGRK